MSDKSCFKKSRCAYVAADGTACKKKTAIGMSSCRCDMKFCMVHRLPEAHDCRYDFRANHLDTMKDQVANMKCVGDKVETRA